MLSYSIDRDSAIVTVTGEDGIDPHDVTELFRRVLADPNYRPGDAFLRDGRHLTAPSAETIHRVVQNIARLSRKPATYFAVCLVAGDDANFGMMRMLQILSSSESVEVGIFYGMDEARAWLKDRMAASGT